MNSSITWTELVAEEPRLLEVLREAMALEPEDGFCREEYVNRYFKFKIRELVGLDCLRKEPEWLSSIAAYNTALTRIIMALPRCQNCSGSFHIRKWSKAEPG